MHGAKDMTEYAVSYMKPAAQTFDSETVLAEYSKLNAYTYSLITATEKKMIFLYVLK